MNEPAAENNEAKFDKNHPIFEFLKSVPDNEVKEYTRKLGKNNLRNFDSIRLFLSKYFFDYNKMPH